MTERPRSRLTIVVGALTIAVMVLIAALFLVKTSPWNDPHPRFHKKTSTSSNKR